MFRDDWSIDEYSTPDMLGIPMILKERATVTTGCTDCGSPLTVDCDPNTPPTTDAVVHFLVPARSWYEDIGWRPRTRDESQAILASVGLTSDFWQLPR